MNPGHSLLRLVVAIYGAIVVLFHLLALIVPSGVSWGVHHLAFLPPSFFVVILLLMIVALVPQAQKEALAYLGRWSGLFTSRKKLMWSLSLVVIGSLFWLWRQQAFFLGDGYLVIRNLSRARSLLDIPTPFPTAPLSAFLAYQIKWVLTTFHVEPAAQLAWQVQSVICGVLAVPIAFKLGGSLSSDTSSKRLFALFILAGGALQLFFGYVETYPPAYVATMVFLWLSMEFLKERLSILLPSIAFGVLFTFHFGMLYLTPAVCVLYVVAIRRKGILPAAVALLITKLLTVFTLWICGYELEKLVKVFSEGGSYFLPLFVHDNWQAAYSLLSGWHLVDLVNAYMLLSPFGILLVPISMIGCWRSSATSRPATIFLLLTLCGALGWTIMTNFEVGMSRDWDVIAPLSVCVMGFALHGWNHVSADVLEKSRLLFGMILITLLHSTAWVSVNANEEHSIARYVVLQDIRVRSQRAIAYASEDLAGFHRDRKQYGEAIPFLETTVAIDSTNARRWLSLANVYQLAGQDGNAVHAYEQSVRHGIRDKAAFFNLGVLYYNSHRLDEAIFSLQRAAALDSADTLVSSNLKMMVDRKAQRTK